MVIFLIITITTDSNNVAINFYAINYAKCYGIKKWWYHENVKSSIEINLENKNEYQFITEIDKDVRLSLNLWTVSVSQYL